MEIERIITRIGIAPSKPYYRLGGERTLFLNGLYAHRKANSACILRVDDSNPKHNLNNLVPINNFFSEEVGFTFDIHPFYTQEKNKSSAQRLGLPALEHESLGSLDVYQSRRQGLYELYAGELIRSEICTSVDQENEGVLSQVLQFHTSRFIDAFGPILHVPNVHQPERKVDLMDIFNHRSPSEQFPKLESIPLLIKTGSKSRTLFALASVVDEALWGITDIIRGNDSKDVQIMQDMLRRILKLPSVNYAYSPLLKDQSGEDPSYYPNLLARGISREAILSYMYTSSVGGNTNEVYSLEEAANSFHLNSISTTADSYINYDQLRSLSKKLAVAYTPEQRVRQTVKAISHIEKMKEVVIDGNDSELKLIPSIEMLVLQEKRPISDLLDSIQQIIEPTLPTEGEIDAFLVSTNTDISRIIGITSFMSNYFNHIDKFEDVNLEDMQARSGLNMENKNDKKIFYGCLRYLLMGKFNGIDPRYSLNFLLSTNKLQNRILTTTSHLNELIQPK